MASFEVGEIYIVTSHNGHTAGDVIEVFFDTTTETYSVEQNDVSVTTLPGVFSQGWDFTTYHTRKNNGFSYQNGEGNIVTFVNKNSFPYYSTQVDEVIGTGVNDVKLSINKVTNASAAGVADGSVVLSASGSNTPFSYSKDNSIFQSSGTFSNLFAKAYTFWVRDSLGYKAQISTLVEVAPFVSTNIKYRGQFDDKQGVKHRIDILLSGYSGSTSQVTMGGTPIILSNRAEGKQPGVDAAAISVSATINLISTTFQQYVEFALSSDFDYKIKYYVDDSVAKDGSDYNLRFEGWLTPESYVEEYGAAPYSVSFTASDRVPDLGDIPYSRPFTGLFQNQSIQSELAILQNCLNRTELGQGFRIAVNMYETTMSTTNTSPFHQAYESEENYYDKDGEPMNCGEVLKRILLPYGAFVVSRDGYWYIIKEEQMKDTSIAYNEFDTDLAYVTNGSISPRIEFKTTGSSDYFRYSGGQSLSFTRPYKEVKVTVNMNVKDSGILPELKRPFLVVGNGLTGFQGYELNIGNELFQRVYEDEDGIGWEFTMIDEQPSNTFFRTSNNLSFTSQDTLEIKAKILASYNIGGFYLGVKPGEPPAYLVMKWYLKIGTKYLQTDGTWTTDQVINQFFIEGDDVEKFVDFKVSALMPDGVTTETEQAYELVMYPISAWEYDLEYADRSTMITQMRLEAADTDKYYPGSRRIVRYSETPGSDTYYYGFYELRIDEDAANDGVYSIKAAGNNRYWFMISSWYEQVNSGQGIFNGRTKTIFRDLEFRTFPQGEEPEETLEIIGKISEKNNQTLEVTLDHFDLPGTTTNDENIYTNYTRLSDGTPTAKWTRLGGAEQKTRQLHLRDRLFELYESPRYKMSATFWTDNEVSILSHLYDAGDGGRVFILNGLEVNPKEGIHRGEILEISKDAAVSAGEFNNDFDIDNEFK